jgi:hypothetical protein
MHVSCSVFAAGFVGVGVESREILDADFCVHVLSMPVEGGDWKNCHPSWAWPMAVPL